jgi:hypothetical protein
MTLHELNTVFDFAVSRSIQTNREDLPPWAHRGAGIRAVVEALRDEFGRIMHPSDDWNRMGVVDVFNEILASDGVEAPAIRAAAGEEGK